MSPAEVKTRAAHAADYLMVATLRLEPGDQNSYNTTGSNAVLAGIAAADAICGFVLGYRAQGHDHKQAVSLLTAAMKYRSPAAAKNLARLLEAKSLTQYGSNHITEARARDLVRSAERLVAEMNQVFSGRQ